MPRACRCIRGHSARRISSWRPISRNADGANARNVTGSVAEIRRYLDAGIDGFFTDDPAVGRLALES